MAAGVVTIERKKYAVGLFWQPLPSGQNSYDFAKQLSKQIPGSVKFYTEYRSMVCVGSRALGHRRGMKIAAVELLNSFSEYNSFLAEFFTPQGFWIVGVRNNIVIFDQLFTSEADAKREFIKLVALPDWDIIIASGSWNIPRAVEKPLREIVVGNSKEALQPIGGAAGNVFSLIVFALIAFGFWHFFHEPIITMFSPRPQQAKINPEVLAEYKRQLAEKDAQIKKQYDTQPVKIVMPYESLPDVSLRAGQCWKSIAYVMQPITGWTQQGAECYETGVRARLNRSYGTLSGLHDLVAKKIKNSIISENTDSDVTIDVKTESLNSIKNSEPSKLVPEIVFAVNTAFQSINEIANVRTSTESVGDGANTSVINIVMVSATSKLKPDEFIKIFDGLAPMSLVSVKWDARSRIWNYEVKIYAK